MPGDPLRPCEVRTCPHTRPCPVDGARASSRMYNGKGNWRAVAKAFLDAHPFCAACRLMHRTTIATDVDHIIDHGGDHEVFWDQRNWQALCHACHSRKTRLTR